MIGVNIAMEKIIAACGNDCAVCPRHLPKSEEELHHTAELWMKIGYRDHIVTNDEISCEGCRIDNWCRYDIIGCTTQKNILNCGKCTEYPCDKIKECFAVTESFVPTCKMMCTDAEFDIMKKAFYEKLKNLDLEKL